MTGDDSSLGQQSKKPASAGFSAVSKTYLLVFFLGQLVFILAGVIWGFTRPVEVLTVQPNGTGMINNGVDAKFHGFLLYVIISSVASVLVSLVTFLRAKQTRGLGMLLWVGSTVFLGSFGCWIIGNAVVRVMHPLAEYYSAEIGQTLTIVPPVALGTAIFLAPLLAIVTYWLGLFFHYATADEAELEAENEH